MLSIDLSNFNTNSINIIIINFSFKTRINKNNRNFINIIFFSKLLILLICFI